MTNTSPQIRLITDSDYAGALAVYAPYVLHTAITFEYDVPSLEVFSERLKAIARHYPVLVCEIDGNIIGYCYGSTHRTKTAYQWSVESTIYIAEAYHHKGIAAILYDCLFNILRLQGFINVYAGISVPKGQSDRFHHKYGFKELCTFEKIGYKHGQWHDLLWFEYILAERVANPAVPLAIREMKDSEEVKEILYKAIERWKDSL